MMRPERDSPRAVSHDAGMSNAGAENGIHPGSGRGFRPVLQNVNTNARTKKSESAHCVPDKIRQGDKY